MKFAKYTNQCSTERSNYFGRNKERKTRCWLAHFCEKKFFCWKCVLFPKQRLLFMAVNTVVIVFYYFLCAFHVLKWPFWKCLAKFWYRVRERERVIERERKQNWHKQLFARHFNTFRIETMRKQKKSNTFDKNICIISMYGLEVCGVRICLSNTYEIR